MRKLLGVVLCPMLVALLWIATATFAHANGRLPAATALAVHPTDDQQILVGLTYGLALSRDGGASWTWMCEQQIEGNGGNIDPAIVMTGDGTLVVLSLTNGGVLVSRNEGCSFERPMGSMQRNRGVDLTLDPSQPGRVLALMSTVVDRDEDAGSTRFSNLLAHSLDHGRTWSVLAELPDDIQLETVEIAASNPKRIYVTGVAGSDRLEGILERSDDGGMSWKRSTMKLPAGSGSMFISAVHPTDPDRLWIRVPAQGDVFGVLPARLWSSKDGGTTFDHVADTQGGMLGFALSPDGDRIALGGPMDGLLVAPSDGSAAPSKVSDMPVTCLRWRANGVYACAIEPTSPFGLGLAPEPAQDFAPLWHRANTCRQSCMPPSPLEMRCQMPWQDLAPMIGATMPLCNGGSPLSDGGMDAGTRVAGPSLDAGAAGPSAKMDASPATTAPQASGKGGCAVTSPGASRPWPLASLLMLAGWFCRPRSVRRRSHSEVSLRRNDRAAPKSP